MRLTKHGLFHLTPRDQVIKPVGEHGYLTPVRATFGCKKTWIWTCRCGATVTREARHVRKSVNEGRTPKCSVKCTGVRKESA